MTAPREFTDEQITEAIGKAVGALDFDAVPGLIMLLASQNLERAQQIFDLLTKGQLTVQVLPR